MEFDRLCKEVERRFPEHRKLMDDARLFVIDTADWPSNKVKTDKPSLRSWHPDEQVIENFRMPFDTLAIQWAEACVVLKEQSAGERRYEMIGCHTSGRCATFFRGIVTAFPNGFDLDSKRLGKLVHCSGLQIYNNGDEVDFSMAEISLRAGEERHLVTQHGEVEWEGSPRGYDAKQSGVRLKIDGQYVNIEDRAQLLKAMPRLKEVVNDIEWSIGAHVANIVWLELNAAVMSMLVICEPSRFVVEHSLADSKPYTGKMIQRSPYRTRYIVLHPEQIKKRYLYDEHETSGIPRMPHERRGHFRRLSSEKFVAKRNHVIWVKPCWVGKTEAVRGKNKYVVRLDL